MCLDVVSRLQLLEAVKIEIDEQFAVISSEEARLEKIKAKKSKLTFDGHIKHQDVLALFSKSYGMKQLKWTSKGETGDYEATFNFADRFLFCLRFEHLMTDNNHAYYLKSGSCTTTLDNSLQESQRGHQEKQPNPLNDCFMVSQIFNRLIATSVSSATQVDSLNFLTFLGTARKRIESLRRSL